VRPITGAEVTLEGDTHITLLCESQSGYANLCRILTDAHAGTRVPGKERDLLPAQTTVEFVAEHAEGLVALSGCARQGLACSTPNARSSWRARSPVRSTSSCSGRTSAATCASQHAL
jgi:DNA polymerase III alpha subunit